MKKNLLLLHGALGSKKQFEVLKPLLENDFHVYDLNFGGHGGAPAATDFSISGFTSELIDFVESKGLEKLHVFGYSMGGYVALNAANKIPEKIVKITTLGTKFNWNKASTEKEVKMLNPQVMEEKVPHFANKLKEDHLPADWKLLVADTASMMMKLSEGEQLVSDDFKKIRTSVTLGLGSLDKMVTREETLETESLLSNGAFVELEGVKHPIESVEVQKLSEFLRHSFL